MPTYKEVEEFKRDLAAYLQGPRRIAWTEIPLGSLVHESDVPRADVYTLDKSYHLNPRIYEVKMSRGDFLHEINTGKWEKYIPYCRQFYFACPAGMLKPEELPKVAGLVVRGSKGWSGVKTARPLPEPDVGVNQLMALILRGYEMRQEAWRQEDKSRLLNFQKIKQVNSLVGKQIAYRLATAEDVLEEMEQLKMQVEEVMGRKFSRTEDLLWGLKEEVQAMLNVRMHARTIVALTDVLNRLFQGSVFWSGGLPEVLREIASRVESEIETAEATRKERGDGLEANKTSVS